jgi:proteasome accessory factor A
MQTCHVPKVMGSDVELASFILGTEAPLGTGHLAAQLLLEVIRGLPARRTAPGAQERLLSPHVVVAEWGRKFLPANGSSCYIDANHFEVNMPECASPADYVAAWQAMVKIADQARLAVDRRLQSGLSLEVMANTSDRRSNSFGSHLSISTTRKAWTSLFDSARLLWLSSYHVSSIICFGAGKVGAENGAAPATFQLAERADFFGQLTSLDTTIPNRGVVNQRNEPLTGKDRSRARYHCIFYDSNLQDVAAYLKAGVLSLVLLMLEADEVDLTAVFEDPIAALRVISRDLTFRATFETHAGKSLTAIDLQSMFLERASRFVEAGRCEGFLPDAPRIIKLWGETLDLLRKNDLRALRQRLDWALKFSILSELLARYPKLRWDSPEIRYADLQYANVDPNKGLFWAYKKAGLVERIVTDERVDFLVSNPPDDTRAYARAMLLRRATPEHVCEIDWDGITFQFNGRGAARPHMRRLEMDDPAGLNKDAVGHVFSGDPTLEEALELFDQRPSKDRSPITQDENPTVPPKKKGRMSV